ncbi:MAG TPA: hypothetical protein VGI71_23650 [Scandinavium sp.]|jgi:hypothetical protein
MTKSLIPARREVRVLLTIKRGHVEERLLHEEELVATPEMFVHVIRSLGRHHGLMGKEISQALTLSNVLKEKLLIWAERVSVPEDIDRGFELVEQLDKIIALQKQAIGE